MRNYSWPFVLDLKKPLGKGVRSLRIIDPNLPDLAGLLAGEKPLLYTDYSPENWPAVRRLCEDLGLAYLRPEQACRKKGFHTGGDGAAGRKMLLIGRDPAKLRRAALCWRESATDPEWGVLLGYPECCVRAYVKWRDRKGGGEELVNQTYANSPAGAGFYFGLNNVFNYFSRLSARETVKSGRISDLNKRLGIFISALHVASWHPCSYACRASEKKAARIYDFIASYMPDYAALLRSLLARPVLFFGKYEFAVLNGKVRGPRVFYGGLEPPVSLLAPALTAALAAGDSAEPAPGKLIVRKGAALKKEIPCAAPPIIMNFVRKDRSDQTGEPK